VTKAHGLPLLLAMVLAACGARSGLGEHEVPRTVDASIPTDAPARPEVDGDPEAADTGIGALDASRPPHDARDPAALDAGGPVRTGSCIELPLGEPPAELEMTFREQVEQADVLILFDATASMDLRIDGLRYRFERTLLPAIEATASDLRVGFASFQDFDYRHPDDILPMPGARTIHPFQVQVPPTHDLSLVQRALDDLELISSIDWPEAQVEALYQVATGAGNGDAIPPGPACPGGGVGYVCFRPRTSPVVLLFTDAPFHEGPEGRFPYPWWAEELAPTHRYDETIAALTAAHIRVAGFWSGIYPGGMSDLRRLAVDTGGVDSDGAPVFVDLGDPSVTPQSQMTSVIRRLFDVQPMGVTLELRDLGGDDGDALTFVEAVETTTPEPFDGARQFPNRYEDVWVGTRVRWVVTLRNDRLGPPPRTRRYRLQLTLRGDGELRLRSRTVTIVVPGLDGDGC